MSAARLSCYAPPPLPGRGSNWSYGSGNNNSAPLLRLIVTDTGTMTKRPGPRTIAAACLLMGIAVPPSTAAAQNRVMCFDDGSDTGKTGVILDCSGVADRTGAVEEWIRSRAYRDHGRVLHVNAENDNFQTVFRLPPLPWLKKLSFKHNNISAIEDQAFTDLPALEELDLSYNSLNSEYLLYT